MWHILSLHSYNKWELEFCLSHLILIWLEQLAMNCQICHQRHYHLYELIFLKVFDLNLFPWWLLVFKLNCFGQFTATRWIDLLQNIYYTYNTFLYDLDAIILLNNTLKHYLENFLLLAPSKASNNFFWTTFLNLFSH